MIVLLPLIENVLMLSFLGVGFYLIERSVGQSRTLTKNALNGLSLGLIAFLVTSTPIELIDGATLDARAGPVLLAGWIAGPVGGIIAACLGGLSRSLVGGSFAFSGVIVFFVYAFIGVAVRHLRIVPRPPDARLTTFVVLILGSFLGASAMFFIIQPSDLAWAWLKNDLPYVLVANALSISYALFVLAVTVSLLKKSETAFEASERLRLAKNASGFGIWDFDVRSGQLIWDARSKQLHGIPEDGFQGTFEDWSQNIHLDDLVTAQDAFVEALASGTHFEAEYRVNLADGSQNTIKGNAIILRDDAGTAERVVGTNIDLTEIRATEARLDEAKSVAVQAQKFDTIGQLTGGVAHDFNNLLAVTMGNLELLKDEIEAPTLDRAEAQALIDASIQATKRGAELTQNMLAYARKARLTPVLLDLNEVVRETEKWMRRTIESRIEIETVLQAGLWPTLADKSSLQSALVNLLVNARDAFEGSGSGQVTIETSNIRVDDEYAIDRNEDIRPGRYVMLAVSDNGCGIPPHVIDKIFDPFFSTKAVGKGSGLGLSMVQGFLKQSGGTVRVYSEIGSGSSFKLYFPAAAKTETSSLATGDDMRSGAGDLETGQRILLVEDRDEVILVLQKTLTGAGFDVVTAKSGDEGFQIFSAQRDFDLVITDIVMPGNLQGPAMAKKIRQIAPQMKFIFLSGYASEATVHGNGLHPADIRLMKPISRNALLKAVFSSLGSPNGNAT
jgi:signal transduction histidine kinase/ActR/RegA family two-component response regulator